MWIRFGEWLLFYEFVCLYSKVSRPPFLLSEFYDLIKFLPIITFIVIFLCRITYTPLAVGSRTSMRNLCG